MTETTTGPDPFLAEIRAQPEVLRRSAAAPWGAIPFGGKLPVAIPGLYPRGHGLG
jgi:hypothetical protein